MHWCICLAAALGTALTCAPSGPQATTYDCPARRNTARAYLSPQLRTPGVLPPPLTFAAATECANGQCGDNKVFYNANDPNPAAAAAATNAQMCPDLCACADDGTCYTWSPTNTDDRVALVLGNFCDGTSFSGCALYALVGNAAKIDDGLIAVDGSGKDIIVSDILNPATGLPYDPRTNIEQFTQIVSATCDGCAGECAQKHPTDY